MEKKKLFAAAFIGIITVSLVAFAQLNTEKEGGNTNWKNATLVNVNNNEEFTIEDLEKPVLVETFAVWCPTCTKQQSEIKKLHDMKDIKSVSINVDPNEKREKVLKHTARNGFNWKYAIASTSFSNSLRKEFGTSVLNPPLAPVIIVCENDSRKLGSGVKSASKLKEEIEKGC